jgi:molybdopterin synthase sulfur carrier subunit
MIRVVLPFHLKVLAKITGEVQLEVHPPVTQRLYACELDLSHESPDTPLPEAVAQGKEPYLVIGAIAGG